MARVLTRQRSCVCPCAGNELRGDLRRGIRLVFLWVLELILKRVHPFRIYYLEGLLFKTRRI